MRIAHESSSTEVVAARRGKKALAAATGEKEASGSDGDGAGG